MINKIKIFSIFKYLSPNLKLRIIFFGIFSILSSFLDIVSIGAVFPLLTSLMDTSYLTSNNLIKSFFNFFSLEISSQNIIQYTLITFIIFLVIATIVKVLLISFIIKTQNVITVFLSKVIFNGTIKQEYLYFSKLDTNKLTSVLTQKINSVSLTIQSILSSISSFISASFIFIGLIFLNLKITLILGLVFSLFFLLIYFFIKKKVANNSEISSKTSDEVIKLIKETLGSIRYYILRDKIELISAVFENKFQKLKKIQIFLAKSNLIPKHLIEAFILVVLALLATIISIKSDNFVMEIPLMGTFILASQRLLPSINLLFINFNNILANHSQVNDVIDFLKNQKTDEKQINTKIIFSKKIILSNISFSYYIDGKINNILRNFNLEINKGEKVAIIGKSGSGKSTLLDLIMGLIYPSNGKLKCDETNITNKNIKIWRKKFSHVPQKIFLIKDTVKNNIIFTKRDVDFDQSLFDLSIKVSGSQFISSLVKKENSDIGEDGSLISGGQRQRIGIARSIYDNTEIISFDEATSALDVVLQNEIYNNLDKYLKNKTFIAITHDENQLKYFDKIIHLKNDCEYEITQNI